MTTYYYGGQQVQIIQEDVGGVTTIAPLRGGTPQDVPTMQVEVVYDDERQEEN